MDKNEFKVVSNRISFEEFFIYEEEGTITYYFICDDKEFTNQLFKDDDFDGEDIKGFTVSVEVPFAYGSPINSCPMTMISPFVEDGDGYTDIDWRDCDFPVDEVNELMVVGMKHYTETMGRRAEV